MNHESMEKKAFTIYRKKLTIAFTAIDNNEIIKIPPKYNRNCLTASIVFYNEKGVNESMIKFFFCP